LRLSR